MIPLLALVAALAGPSEPCSAPVARHPSYITPGALSDVVYRDGLALDAYALPGEPRPAAVIIHGSRGNKTTHVTQLFDLLSRAGLAWFSPDYRTLDDVVEAIRFIRCAGRFNITDEIVLIGEDTGAQVALELAAQGGFRGVITFGAKFSPEIEGWRPGTAGSGPAASPRPKPRDPAGPALPTAPVLMFHGTNDDKFPAARAEALCKKMEKCVFYPVAGGIHNFENWHPDQWHWKEELTAWLRGDRRGLWKDIAFARPGGSELLMDAFLPAGRGPFPAVVIVHGGGWEAGDKVTYVSPIFEPLARAGFAWFSIDYRLTPYVHIPEQLEDLGAAVRYVREHAARFHVDPNRLAVLGESASGHLVAQLASQPCPGCEVQAVVSFYGVYDFTEWRADAERAGELPRLFGDWTPDTLRRYSPLYSAKPGLAPILLIQGTHDELYKGTLQYSARLKEVGARSELLLLEGAPHGMENWEGHPEWAHYKQRLVDWLLSVVGRQ